MIIAYSLVFIYESTFELHRKRVTWVYHHICGPVCFNFQIILLHPPQKYIEEWEKPGFFTEKNGENACAN